MRRTIAVAAALAAFLFVGASAQASSRHTGISRSVSKVGLFKTVNVAASEFKFVLSAKSASRGLVVFKVKNVGKLTHDFKINGRSTKMISPGQSDTLRVTFLRKGAYPYTCTVPGHAAAGMKGVFTIS
jgi:uncharacterized cupredoxin-like copper-binding protein